MTLKYIWYRMQPLVSIAASFLLMQNKIRLLRHNKDSPLLNYLFFSRFREPLGGKLNHVLIPTLDPIPYGTLTAEFPCCWRMMLDHQDRSAVIGLRQPK